MSLSAKRKRLRRPSSPPPIRRPLPDPEDLTPHPGESALGHRLRILRYEQAAQEGSGSAADRVLGRAFDDLLALLTAAAAGDGEEVRRLVERRGRLGVSADPVPRPEGFQSKPSPLSPFLAGRKAARQRYDPSRLYAMPIALGFSIVIEGGEVINYVARLADLWGDADAADQPEVGSILARAGLAIARGLPPFGEPGVSLAQAWDTLVGDQPLDHCTVCGTADEPEDLDRGLLLTVDRGAVSPYRLCLECSGRIDWQSELVRQAIETMARDGAQSGELGQ